MKNIIIALLLSSTAHAVGPLINGAQVNPQTAISISTLTVTGATGMVTTKLAASGAATITGQETVVSTMTVLGSAFSVGGSTFVVAGGNVGIGTASPGSKLEVAGDVAVTGNINGQLFTKADCRTKCAASPCTLTAPDLNITNVTRTGTGSYQINFVSGVYSASPSCVVTSYNQGAANGFCVVDSNAQTSTAQSFDCRNIAGALQDDDFVIFCSGTH